jgi:hypothetical protein
MWRWFIGALFMAGSSAAVSAVLLIALTHATTSNHNLIAQNRILITQLQARDDALAARDQKFAAFDAQEMSREKALRAFILLLQKQIESLGGTSPTLPPSLAAAPAPIAPSTPSPSSSPHTNPTPTPKPTVNPRPSPTPSPTCLLPVALLCHPLGR